MRLYSFAFKAMGSACELRLYSKSEAQAQQIAETTRNKIEQMEMRYSRYLPESLASRINAAAGTEAIKVDDETAALLDYADQAYRQSDGLFDITSGVLRQAWDFKSGELPSQAQIEPWLGLVGWNKVHWRPPLILLPEAGMQIDFGGYVKEYAADTAANCCTQGGIQHGLVDMGGDVRIIGPHPDGRPWQVGIRHPRAPLEALASIEMSTGGLASSGDYERYMEVGGRRYCHILNPKTGWPVADLAAVSVVAEQTLVAGTLSTIAMLKGREGPAWLAEAGVPHLWVNDAMQTGGSLVA